VSARLYNSPGWNDLKKKIRKIRTAFHFVALFLRVPVGAKNAFAFLAVAEAAVQVHHRDMT
jgi:hypothetical protein